MATQLVTLDETRDHLSDLVEAVELGQEVLIETKKHTFLKVTVTQLPRPERTLDVYKGMIRIHEDFGAPLPDAFWLGKDA